jgi:hypothetical protein
MAWLIVTVGEDRADAGATIVSARIGVAQMTTMATAIRTTGLCRAMILMPLARDYQCI